MRTDPALLECRMKGGPTPEQRPAQTLIMLCTPLGLIALLAVPALDDRFAWSAVPLAGILVGDALATPNTRRFAITWSLESGKVHFLLLKLRRETGEAMAAALAVLTGSPARSSGKYDRLFYGGMAVVMGLTVFAGFSRTYYLRFFSGGPSATINGNPFTSLVHLHGALFTAWVLLFIVQTAFIASHRVRAHRRLGVAGAMLAAAMVTAGTSLALVTTARGATPPGIDPFLALSVPIFDMVLFTGFVATALAMRRDRETHKRLMLLAYVSIIVAAMGRIPIAPAPGLFSFVGMSLFFVAVGAIYDVLSRRRIHQTYLWGGLIIAVSVPMRFVIGSTGPWRALAERLTTGLR